ncbi:MAG: hypothetical protein RLZZ403_715 [Pseudomonadota bacterium]|jgi:hypothetical protein
MNQQFPVTVKLFVRSREREDDLPKQEVLLVQEIALPMPPCQGLWLNDISTLVNVIVETVAIEGGRIVVYAKPWEISEFRVQESAQRLVEDGWRRWFAG